MSKDDAIRIHREVVFARPQDRAEPLRLDVYEPATDEDGGEPRRPAVVLYHGGAWREGEKGQLEALARTLAGHGYVCADANYRLSGEANFPAPVRDAAAAVRFLRSNREDYGVDPGRIAAAGHSAGAHIAALVAAADGAFDPDDDAVDSTLTAAVGVSGIYDFRGDEEPGEVTRQFLGGSPAAVPDRYERASPAAHVGPTTPPMLLLHGADDAVLPPALARSFAESLRAADRPVELGLAPDVGHTLPHDGPWRDRAPETIVDFLDRRLDHD